MDKQKQQSFLKSLCPKWKIEFNNIDNTFPYSDIPEWKNIYFLAWVTDPNKRNKDDDIIFKNYFCVDFDLRANYKELNNKILDDESLDVCGDFIKKELEKNWYGDWRYFIYSGNWYHFYYVWEWDTFDKKDYSMAVEYYYNEIDWFMADWFLMTDHSIKNIGRILRLPWTFNYGRQTKFELEPKECIILEEQNVVSDKIKNIPKIAEKIKITKWKTDIKREMKNIDDPVLQAILEMNIIPLVEEFTKLKVSWDNRNFKWEDGVNTGMFVVDNVLYPVWTKRVDDKKDWYNTYLFVKYNYNLSDKETFERFKSRYNLQAYKPKAKIIEDDDFVIDFVNRIPFTRGLPTIDRKFGRYDYWRFNMILWESQSWKTEFTFFQARENAKLYKVLYLSLEMPPKDMLIRYWMKRAWVDKTERSNKTLSPQKQQVMQQKIDDVRKIKNLKIIWLDNSKLDDVEDVIREYYLQWYQLFFIDNLWFIYSDKKEIESTAEASRRLKHLTNIFPISINLVHHFNKWNSKLREQYRGLADIRSSWKLENDIDNAVSVNRDLSPDDDISKATRSEVNIILLKDRVFGEPTGQTVYFYKWEYVEQNPFNWL